MSFEIFGDVEIFGGVVEIFGYVIEIFGDAVEIFGAVVETLGRCDRDLWMSFQRCVAQHLRFPRCRRIKLRFSYEGLVSYCVLYGGTTCLRTDACYDRVYHFLAKHVFFRMKGAP